MSHPILFGVVVGTVVAPAYLVLGFAKSFTARFTRGAVVATTSFLSMSSGPITAMFIQVSLVSWEEIFSSFKKRWILFFGIIFCGYIVIALGSNQTVFQFAITHFSFSPENAYYRILIWEFGSSSVMNHPLFGTGLGQWDRPEWMPPSIDMFWLYNAITYGLPSAIAIMAAFVAAFASISLKTFLSEQLKAFKLAYLASMASLFWVGWTVHFWNATYVLFLFMLGSGVWLLDADPVELSATSCAVDKRSGEESGVYLEADLRIARRGRSFAHLVVCIPEQLAFRGQQVVGRAGVESHSSGGGIKVIKDARAAGASIRASDQLPRPRDPALEDRWLLSSQALTMRVRPTGQRSRARLRFQRGIPLPLRTPE